MPGYSKSDASDSGEAAAGDASFPNFIHRDETRPAPGGEAAAAIGNSSKNRLTVQGMTMPGSMNSLAMYAKAYKSDFPIPLSKSNVGAVDINKSNQNVNNTTIKFCSPTPYTALLCCIVCIFQMSMYGVLAVSAYSRCLCMGS